MEFYIQQKKYTYDDLDEWIKHNLFKFNYYNGLNKMGNKQLTDDIGWSCTIKSFQMMLANYMNQINKEIDIVSLLYKQNGDLSIKKFITELNNLKYEEGKHLGSFLISKIYQQMIQNTPVSFEMHVTDDNLLDIQEIDFNKNNIFLYSTRLGLTTFDSKYYQLIKNCFLNPSFLGFVGGVGTASYYFFGYEPSTEYLVYLDPHVISKYKSTLKLKQLQAKHYSIVHISHINPSILFCFYSCNEKKFITFKKFLELNTCFNILNKQDYQIKNNSTTDSNWELL
tara:strand:- start:337 stop:1182 length:846 start_codon:yes stop_codon:yes gene_type:complete